MRPKRLQEELRLSCITSTSWPCDTPSRRVFNSAVYNPYLPDLPDLPLPTNPLVLSPYPGRSPVVFCLAWKSGPEIALFPIGVLSTMRPAH